MMSNCTLSLGLFWDRITVFFIGCYKVAPGCSGSKFFPKTSHTASQHVVVNEPKNGQDAKVTLNLRP